MTNRETLINYVKNGGDRFYCSVQIGSGAGFEAKLAGKTWMCDATLEDVMNACGRYDMLPLYNCGMLELTQLTTELRWEVLEQSEVGSVRTRKQRLVTPKGTLEMHTRDDELKGGLITKYSVTEEDDLAALEYYLDAILEVKDYSAVAENTKYLRSILGEEAMDIQWAVQPYELLGFSDACETAVLVALYPEKCKRLMEKIVLLDEKLFKEVKRGGGDFVFLGSPGSEIISPTYYENYIVPYSKIVTEMAHQSGLLIYSHICSPIEPMLTMGYYNQMGIDLFETLSQAPEGNVKSIEDAFAKLSPDMCTRGNISLHALLTETPDQIKERCFNILETAKKLGRKHLLAASDYLFYQTPEENVAAMCEAVCEYNHRAK